jgi:hypothetical protein
MRLRGWDPGPDDHNTGWLPNVAALRDTGDITRAVAAGDRGR